MLSLGVYFLTIFWVFGLKNVTILLGILIIGLKLFQTLHQTDFSDAFLSLFYKKT